MITEPAPRLAPTPSQPLSAGSVAVVVLGAGRSGTSALARGLQALGVNLGERLRPPGGKNPTGFFEDRDLLAFNKRRLKPALGIRGHSVRLVEDAQWHTPALRALQQEAVQIIRTRFGNSPLWGYKYARTLRFLPFWLDVYRALDLDVRFVMALRNPLSVGRSRGKLNPDRGRVTWTGLEWLVNVVPYFRELRVYPLVLVDYDALMESPAEQLARIARHLRIPPEATTPRAIAEYAHEFLRPGMRHSRFGPQDLRGDADLPALVSEAYGWLHRLAHDEIAPDDQRFWAAWGHIEASLRDLAPILREMDWLRLRLEQARWNPLTPLLALRQLWRDYRNI